MDIERSGQLNDRRVELLAPAGNMEAFRGALHAGADAVYLAGQSFGARAYAENFSEEEIVRVLRDAHLFGVRVYLTANVLTRERELSELVSFVSRLYEKGLDGVIVQDLGVAAALRSACPGLPLHASTQMSVMGPDAVRLLQRMGFTRIVPARELSLTEIRSLKETGAEIETFIHGAMCYSCSGRCLMSSYLGGRSGNRGRCAGTCRLPYEIFDETGRHMELLQDSGKTCAGMAREKDHRRTRAGTSGTGLKDPASYPLSMKDLCVLPILPDLMDAGIDSFKIEGRMKKPEYAAGVTAIYRRYIDRFYDWDAQGRPGAWEIAPDDLEDLRSLYLRTDLSTGYYHERNGRDMVTIGEPGYRGASEELLIRIRREYIGTGRKLAIGGSARIVAGEAVRLEVWALYHGTTGTEKAGCSFLAEGDAAEPAQKRPLTEGSIREKLEKTGDTPFEFSDLSLFVETDNRSFVPVSALNDLRRKALEGLQEEILRSYRRPLPPGSAALRTGPDRRDRGRAERSFRNQEAGECPKTKTSNRENAIYTTPEMDGHNMMYRTGVPRELSDSLAGTRLEEEFPESQTFCAAGAGDVPPMRNGSHVMRQMNIPGTATDSLAGTCRKPCTLVALQNASQADAALQFDVDGVILDGEIRDHPEQMLRRIGESEEGAGVSRTVSILAALPQILRESDEGWLERYYDRYGEVMDGFLVRCLEELEFLRRKGYKGFVIADSSLYCWNRSALEVWKLFSDFNVLPLELNRKELEQTFDKELPRMLLPVYGRAPMMITANCVRRTGGRCPKERDASGSDLRPAEGGGYPSGAGAQGLSGEGGGRRSGSCYCYLQDRTGAVFPVQIDCAHCHNVIYNSVPTSLLPCLQDPKDRLMQRVGGWLLSFTDEAGEETRRVLAQSCPVSGRQISGRPESSALQSCGVPSPGTKTGGRSGSDVQQGCGVPSPRAKRKGRPDDRTLSFTYGHYRRGAL